MNEKTARNPHAMAELQKVYDKRAQLIQKQQEDFRMQMVEGEVNFIRNQRVRAYEEAYKFKKADDSMETVIENAAKIFSFYIADGVYDAQESNLIKA